MATVANTVAPIGAVTTLRVVDAIINVKSTLVEFYSARATRKALFALSDRQLDDIGLTRKDIELV